MFVFASEWWNGKWSTATINYSANTYFLYCWPVSTLYFVNFVQCFTEVIHFQCKASKALRFIGKVIKSNREIEASIQTLSESLTEKVFLELDSKYL